jgi:hypothetical protein
MRTLPALIVASTLIAACGGSPPSSSTDSAKNAPAAAHDAHGGPSGPPASVADWAHGAMMKIGTAALAEKVYRDDLVKHPANGWALFGLQQALMAQHKTAEAAAVERQFMDAWTHADVKLSASVF